MALSKKFLDMVLHSTQSESDIISSILCLSYPKECLSSYIWFHVLLGEPIMEQFTVHGMHLV